MRLVSVAVTAFAAQRLQCVLRQRERSFIPRDACHVAIPRFAPDKAGAASAGFCRMLSGFRVLFARQRALRSRHANEVIVLRVPPNKTAFAIGFIPIAATIGIRLFGRLRWGFGDRRRWWFSARDAVAPAGAHGILLFRGRTLRWRHASAIAVPSVAPYEA